MTTIFAHARRRRRENGCARAFLTRRTRTTHLMHVGWMSLAFTIVLACAGVSAVPTPSSTPSVSSTPSTRSTPWDPSTSSEVAGDEKNGTGYSDTAQFMSMLPFEEKAVNLALQKPYDTVQLRAVPRAFDGIAIHDTNTVYYTTPDSAAIRLSVTGLVTALHVTPLARVIARRRRRQDGWIATDTAYIQITQQPLPAPLATFSIQPQAGGLPRDYCNPDTTEHNIPCAKFIPVFATMATKNPATAPFCTAPGCQYPLLVHFTSSDSSIALIDQTAAFKVYASGGHVILTASTVAYGVRKVDSLPFSVFLTQHINDDLSFAGGEGPAALTIRQGKNSDLRPYKLGVHVHLKNYTGTPVEVSVSGPAHGAHFVGWYGVRAWPRALDTLGYNSSAGNGKVTVVLDSAGTYTLKYQSLESKAVHSDTITVYPYP